MAATRLALVLLVLGTLVLLLVQNPAPTLPLVFLGSRTLALPLGVWLVAALGAGALTTLVLTALLKTKGGSSASSRRYQYEPQPFYEPAAGDRTGASEARTAATSDYSAGRSSSPPPWSAPAAEASAEWQAWTNLKSPGQWEDWEAMGNAPRPETTPSPPRPRGRGWFGGPRPADPTERVNDSLKELAEDWGDLERRPYRAAGVSPVEDSLDELTQGWDDLESASPPSSPRDFEVPQSPKQVYREGSIYSYSYRDRASPGQTDRIYAPADHERDAENSTEGAGYGSSGLDDADNLEDPELAEEGVVDADYRVLIPPYSPPAAAAPEPDQTRGEDPATDWAARDDSPTDDER